ncbi:MAG: zinc ABC transporter substrate-binding protein [Methanotrichaceae archaeon]|nr:zinc ABC transporter substrate-binding protein [Methanotrichaceae archaeon]
MRISSLVLLALVPIICGCISQNEIDPGLIKIVTTIAPLEELIRSVGGDKVHIAVMVPPGAEPHTYEPTPIQMKQVADADLYVKNGAGLEFWMDKILQVNKEMLILDSAQGVDLIGEVEGEIDPHIWLSLPNAAIQVGNICTGLIKLDPGNADYYLKNRDDYLENLKILDAELNQTFTSKEKKIFIVYHPSWTYFARDYDLEQVSLMENEKEPGPKYLTEVVELGEKNNISMIFVEPEFNPKPAEVIAREMDAQVVTIDPLAGNYLENMRYVGSKIAESL